jgi:hypothetical protein
MDPILRITRQQMLIVLTFALGLALYLYGIFSSFGVNLDSSELYEIMIVTAVGGLASLFLGYVSVVVFGGMASLRLVEFISRFTRAKHVVELADERHPSLQGWIRKQIMIFVMPILIFLLSVGLAWDIHNLHDPRTFMLHSILHALDIFSSPLIVEPVLYSIEIVLAMIVLVAIAGVIPALVLPYFRRFKITGINSGPFHTDLLITLVGLVVGLSAILTLVGIVFEVMWVGQGPSYYHYVIPVMMGLSMQYAIGIFMGRERSEDMVEARLEAHSGKRVLRGTVNVRTPVRDENSRPESTKRQ